MGETYSKLCKCGDIGDEDVNAERLLHHKKKKGKHHDGVSLSALHRKEMESLQRRFLEMQAQHAQSASESNAKFSKMSAQYAAESAQKSQILLQIQV